MSRGLARCHDSIDDALTGVASRSIAAPSGGIASRGAADRALVLQLENVPSEYGTSPGAGASIRVPQEKAVIADGQIVARDEFHLPVLA